MSIQSFRAPLQHQPSLPCDVRAWRSRAPPAYLLSLPGVCSVEPDGRRMESCWRGCCPLCGSAQVEIDTALDGAAPEVEAWRWWWRWWWEGPEELAGVAATDPACSGQKQVRHQLMHVAGGGGINSGSARHCGAYLVSLCPESWAQCLSQSSSVRRALQATKRTQRTRPAALELPRLAAALLLASPSPSAEPAQTRAPAA